MSRKSLFICYASDDRSAAERLEKALEAHDVDVRIDSRLDGVLWDQYIPDAMAACDGVVIILTTAWRQERLARGDAWYAVDEVHFAIDVFRRRGGRYLVAPVISPDFDRSDFPYGLRRVSAVTADLATEGLAQPSADRLAAQLVARLDALGLTDGDAIASTPLLTRMCAHWARDHYVDPSDGQVRRLTDIYVEPPPLDTLEEPCGSRRLQDLLSTVPERTDTGTTPRWCVVGRAGAGKSLHARWLMWLLANGLCEVGEAADAVRREDTLETPLGSDPIRIGDTGPIVRFADDTPDTVRWVPLYLTQSTPDLHPTDALRRDLRKALGSAFAKIGDELDRLFDDPGGRDRPVFVIEVPRPSPELLHHLEASLSTRRYESVPVIILLREEWASSTASLPHFAVARMRPHPSDDRVRLVRRHLRGGEDNELFEEALRVSGLGESSPLVLQWLAASVAGDRAPFSPPRSRLDVWERICRLYIGADAAEGRGSGRAHAVRYAWGLLLYELEARGGLPVPRRILERAMRHVFERTTPTGVLDSVWGLPGACLDDLLAHDRVLVSKDGQSYDAVSRLVTDALLADSLWAGRSALAREWSTSGEHRLILEARGARTLTSRWANVNFIASLRFEDPLHVVTLNTEYAGWDGETLFSVLREWMRAEGVDDPSIVIDAVLEWSARSQIYIEDSARLRTAAYIHHTLDRLGRVPERFFGLFGLPPPPERATERAWVDLSPRGDVVTGCAPAEIEPFFESAPDWLSGVERAGSDDERWRRGALAERERRQRVRLSGRYRLAESPVTVAEFRRFDPGHDPARSHKAYAEHPVVRVDWWQAQLYAGWCGARLPTEAEWEYACRAGGEGPYSKAIMEALHARGGVALADFVHFGAKQTAAVASSADPSRQHNGLGLYDMSGNVWEWTRNRFVIAPPEAHSRSVAERGLGCGRHLPSDETPHRVARGGAFNEKALWVRCASRTRAAPDRAYATSGLRLARDQPGPA